MRVCVYVSVALLLLGLHVETRRSRFKPKLKPKKDVKPVEEILPAQNIDISQMSGKWFLLTTASRCKNLLENAFKVESTTMTLTAPESPDSPMLVTTFRKHNYQCWEIRQHYESTGSPGHLLLKGNQPEMNVKITIVETDYKTYAILVYKRMDKITMKLYGRTTEVTDAIVDTFEKLAQKQNLGLDVVIQFPDYGFCDSADKEHVLVMT
ncbi:methionine-R-sulfoxide reductase B2, mitochondrial isoform X1 [Brachyhypopomus gauderio]|uniref:methionine-R-sulfoxide reductase B2, mitochondrial isoform X1 n=1 Tax=Brachyhypopomus gauderio TaxID=698409 RepID=UPI004042FBB0